MSTTNWTTRALLLGVLTLAVAAPGASAKGPGIKLTVAPAKPTATDAIRVSFRVPIGAAKGERYGVAVTAPANGQCASNMLQAATGPIRAGTTVTVQLTANRHGAYAGWCAGKATATLMRQAAGRGWTPVRGVRRSFTIRLAPGFRPAPFGTKVDVDVLPTSTATVTAPGRATRVLGLGGGLDGFIAGRFLLNSDYRISLAHAAGGRNGEPPRSANAVVVRSLVTDPLCASPAIHTLAPMAAEGVVSGLTFLRDGNVAGKLFLAADPTTLAGCAGPDTGATTLDLSGRLGVAKLADLLLTATLATVPVGGGATGAVDVALHLKINILD